jgi:hypothetical protein
VSRVSMLSPINMVVLALTIFVLLLLKAPGIFAE